MDKNKIMKQIDFSIYELNIEEQRHTAFCELNSLAYHALSNLGISAYSFVTIEDRSMEIGLMETKQGETYVPYKIDNVLFGGAVHIRETNGTVKIGTSGNPDFDPSVSWLLPEKHRNLATLSLQWDKTKEIFHFFTAEHRRLKKLITEATGVAL